MAKRKVLISISAVVGILAVMLIFSLALFKAEGETDISNAVITLASEELTYTGGEQTVVITSVVLPGETEEENITLNEGTDYVIVQGTNKGTLARPVEGVSLNGYTLTLQGIDQYTGTASKSWSITGGEHSYSLVEYSWTGSEIDGYTAAAANFRCSHCGKETSLDMEIESHIEVPTCETDGYTQYLAGITAEANIYTNVALNDSKTALTTSATGHNWDEGVVTVEPTISSAGVMTYTCQNNPEHTRTEEIPSLEPVTLSVYKTTVDGNTQSAVTTIQMAGGSSINAEDIAAILAACPEDEVYEAGSLIVNHPLSYYASTQNPATQMSEDSESFLTSAIYADTDVYVFAKKKISALSVNVSIPSCGQDGSLGPTISLSTGDVISQGIQTTVEKSWGSIDSPYEETLLGGEEYSFEYKAENVNVDYRYSLTAATQISANTGVTVDATQNDENTINFTGSVTAVHVPKSMEYEDVIEPTCEEDGSHNEVIRCYSCNEIISSSHVVDVKTGHDWEFDEFVISEDENGITAIAKFVCANDASHKINKTATVGDAIVQEANCEEEGYTGYPISLAADVSPDGEEHTDTYKKDVTPALGHTYVYNGNERVSFEEGAGGRYTATFEYHCNVCDKVETVSQPNITPVVVEATCTSAGSVTATATIPQVTSLDGEEHSVTTVISSTSPLGHDWQFVSFNCTLSGGVIEHTYANFKCSHDELHTQSVEVTAERNSEACVEPSCEETGADVWMASISALESLDGQAHENANLYTFTINALGHNYIYDTSKDVAWDTSGETYSAHFPFVCDRAGCGNETTVAVSDIAPEGTAPSCTAGGSVTATATLTADASPDGLAHTDTYESSSAQPLGHIWSFIDFTISGEALDGFAGSHANFVCERPGCGQTDTVEAAVTGPVSKVADCTESGKDTYTFTVSVNPDGDAISEETTTWDTNIVPALGHDFVYTGDENVVWTEGAEGKYTATFGYACSRCGEPASYSVSNIVPQKTSATCEAGGKTVVTATTSAQSPDKTGRTVVKTVEETPALGHNWIFKNFGFAGSNIYAYYVCGNDSSHSNAIEANIDDMQVSDPTCTEGGNTAYYVSVNETQSLDGASHSDVLYADPTDALGHDWGNWDVIKEPTETERGLQRRVCNNDPSHIEEEEILATGEPVYVNIEGEDATITQGSDEIPKFVFKRALHDELTFDNFEGIMLDGVPIDSSLYTAKPGSVIIEFKPEFIASMGEGDHVLTAMFSDGDNVGVAFKVAKAAADSGADKSSTDEKGSGAADTGDSARPILWIVILVAAAAAVVVIVFVKRANGKKDDDNKNE